MLISKFRKELSNGVGIQGQRWAVRRNVNREGKGKRDGIIKIKITN
jgi:hypothetical protein